MTIIDCIRRANGRPTLRYGRLLQGLIARDLVGACYTRPSLSIGLYGAEKDPKWYLFE